MLTRENQELFREWVYHLRTTRSDLTDTSIHVLAREYAIEGRPVPLRPTKPLEFPRELRPGPLEALALWKTSRFLRRLKGLLMADMVNLPGRVVSHKTIAATGGSVVASVVCWVALHYLELQLDPEDVAAYLGTTISIAVFVASWVKRLSAREVAMARLADGTPVAPQATPKEASR